VAELITLTGGAMSDNNASVVATIMACILPRIMYVAKKFTPPPGLYLCASQNGTKAIKRARFIATHSCL
jgi:hypothetical protein